MERHDFVGPGIGTDEASCQYCGHHKLCLVHEGGMETWKCRRWRTRCEVK